MNTPHRLLYALLASFTLMPALASAQSVHFKTDFTLGSADGWTARVFDLPAPIYHAYMADFRNGRFNEAGYPKPPVRPEQYGRPEHVSWFISWGIADAPQSGLKVFYNQGFNHSDDLDHWVFRKIKLPAGGLPFSRVTADVRIWSNSSRVTMGVGGNDLFLLKLCVLTRDPSLSPFATNRCGSREAASPNRSRGVRTPGSRSAFTPASKAWNRSCSRKSKSA